MITDFPKIRSGDNLETCLDNFQDILVKAEIDREDWIARLKSVLRDPAHPETIGRHLL